MLLLLVKINVTVIAEAMFAAVVIVNRASDYYCWVFFFLFFSLFFKF